MSKKQVAKTPDDRKMNVVNKTIIQNENIKKEIKYFSKNVMEHFQLNPHNMYLLTEKPNYIVPSRPGSNQSSKPQGDDIFGQHFTEDPVEEAFSNEKLGKILKTTTLVPKQKYLYPQTSSQEVGWFSNQLTVERPTRDHKIKSNEITKFANDYFEMTKENPFKKKR